MTSGGADASARAADAPLRIAFGDFPAWTSLIRPNLGPRYAAEFLDLERAPLDEFTAVIPVQLLHYEPLRRHPEWQGRKFIIPCRDTVALCDDKLRCAEALIAAGFAAQVPRLRGPGAPYPYMRKRRHGWWGMQCQIIDGPGDETAIDPNDPAWFCQECVDGPFEFATHVLRAQGEIRYASTVAYKMASRTFIKGSRDTPVHTRLLPGCAHRELFGAILECLGFEGTACIDYKIVEGAPVIFEINPRFGGSLSLDITRYLDAYVAALRT
jgi:hypothetical protein